MIQLRNYQQSVVDEVRLRYAAGIRAPMVVMPTGAGKTTVFSYVTTNAAAKSRCVYLLCHRAELVKQITMTLGGFGCAHQVIAPPKIVRQCQIEQHRKLGRSWVDHRARVFVASAQTIVKRLEGIPTEHQPDLIIIDEAHHLTRNSTWGKIVDAFPKAKLLPVTATPCRLDGKGLGVDSGGFADAMVLGPSMRELIDMGYLSPYRIFAPPTALDLSKVKIRAGDYAKDQLGEAIDKPTITGDAVDHYCRLAAGKRAVVFCVSVEHARHVAEQFMAAGVPAEMLDGNADPDERDACIKRFERGDTLVLTSCEIVSEGFDLPSIEVAILLRPTKSTSLFLQQVGRALRVFPGKDEAIIFDHVGAIRTHGFPDDDREWSLDGITKKKRAANDNGPAVNVQVCPKCFSVHRPEPKCPACGYVYTAKERKLEVAEGELVEVTREQKALLRAQAERERAMQQRQRKTEESQCKTLEDFIELGKSRGYAFPRQWAEKRFAFRQQRRA